MATILLNDAQWTYNRWNNTRKHWPTMLLKGRSANKKGRKSYAKCTKSAAGKSEAAFIPRQIVAICSQSGLRSSRRGRVSQHGRTAWHGVTQFLFFFLTFYSLVLATKTSGRWRCFANRQLIMFTFDNSNSNLILMFSHSPALIFPRTFFLSQNPVGICQPSLFTAPNRKLDRGTFVTSFYLVCYSKNFVFVVFFVYYFICLFLLQTNVFLELFFVYMFSWNFCLFTFSAKLFVYLKTSLLTFVNGCF